MAIKFLRAIKQGTMLTVTRLGFGLARTKVAALVIGSAGVGLLAQASQFHLLCVSIASISLSAGVITRVARAREEENREDERLFLGTAWTIQFFLTLILSVISLGFAAEISNWIFGDSSLKHYIYFLAFSVPLTVLASGYLESYYFISQRYDRYVKASMLASIVGSTLIIIMTVRDGLNGAIVGLFLNAIILASIFMFFTREMRQKSFAFQFVFSWKHFRDLVGIGLASFVVGSAHSFILLELRGEVISRFGADLGGIVQVPLALTSYYSAILTNGLWGHLHPIVSQKGDSDFSHQELLASLDWIAWIQTAFAVTFLPLAYVFIVLFYSDRFLPALQLLPWQLLGDFFYFQIFAIGVYWLALARLRSYFIFWGLFFCGWPVATFYFFNLGEHQISIFYSYAGAAAVTGLMLFCFIGRSFGWAKVQTTFSQLGLCLLLLLVQIAIAQQPWPIFYQFLIPLVTLGLLFRRYRSLVLKP